MPLSLYLLAIAAFAIGTTEFVIMGLLPDVGADLHIGLPQAGLLVTAYAMGVVVGAPVLAAVTARLPRRPALLGLFMLFIAGNLACAMAPTYSFLMGARIVTAWSHGAFLGIVGVVASYVVPPAQQSRANALIFGGITLANVLGVPAGVAVGHLLGWRAAFWSVTVLAAMVTVALAWMLPTMPRTNTGSLRAEFAGLRTKEVWLSLALSAANSASLLCLLTYMTPYLTDVLGFTSSLATVVLFLFGLGLTLGTQGAGRSGDKSLLRTLALGLGAAVVLLLALPHAGSNPVAAVAILFGWGMCSFGICPVMHTLVMRSAGAAPMLASTLNHSAFNLGNAAGAWLGSLALASGAGLEHVPYASAALAGVAMLVLAARSYVQQPWTLRSIPRTTGA